MRAKEIVALLQALGVDPASIHVGEEWVSCSCPLAKVTHSKHKDERPSFGISISPDGRSVYNCFSCSPDAKPLEYLFSRFWSVFGVYPREAAQIFMGQREHGKDVVIPELPEYWSVAKQERKSITQKELERFPMLHDGKPAKTRAILRFLQKERGIDRKTIFKFGLRYWKSMSGIVVFPWTDQKGKVEILSLRSIYEKRCFRASAKMLGRKTGRKPHSPKTCGAWFGMEHIDQSRPIIIVEGELDCMRLVTLGEENVIAAAGKAVSELQLASLGCSHLIIGLDADEKGFEAAKKLKEQAKSKFTMTFLDWSIVNRTDGKPCKDGNHLPDVESLQKVLSKETERPKCRVLQRK